MPETAHIYIYGDIGMWQSADAESWGEVTLTTVRNQYEAQKNAQSITLHIHSPGGYVNEGFAIHDYIRSLGKPVHTVVEGMCYSIATVIAMAGDTRSMTSNSDFMIHNPWGGAWGESTEIQKYADELKELEVKVADFYAAKTKITSDEALELMKEETFMTPEQALEKGFITEIASVMKAVAKYSKSKSKKNMSKRNDKKGILAKLADLLSDSEDPQMKIVTDANGVEIDFTELEEDDTPSVGDMATIDGSAAEGEHVMPSGETYVFTDGELTEIKPEEEGDGDAMDALKEENVQLKKDAEKNRKEIKALKKANETAKAKQVASEKKLNKVLDEVKAIKKSLGSEFEIDDPERQDPPTPGSKTRSLWKKEEEK